jgi:hypothetical protein
MNKQTVSQRIARSVRIGVTVAAVAATSLIGLGLVAGEAGAKPIGGPTPPTKVSPCASAVSLNTTYSYSYSLSSGQVLSLGGSGCSTTANPVTITIPAVEVALANPCVPVPNRLCGPPPYAVASEKVTPGICIDRNCVFSFSINVAQSEAPLFLTAADADAAEGNSQAAPIDYVATQARKTSNLYFGLWSPGPVPPPK